MEIKIGEETWHCETSELPVIKGVLRMAEAGKKDTKRQRAQKWLWKLVHLRFGWGERPKPRWNKEIKEAAPASLPQLSGEEILAMSVRPTQKLKAAQRAAQNTEGIDLRDVVPLH